VAEVAMANEDPDLDQEVGVLGVVVVEEVVDGVVSDDE